VPFLGLGILGTFLLSSQGVADEVGGILKNRFGSAVGVAAALGSALTETAMYFVVKEHDAPTPWQPLLQLYGGALVWFLAGLAIFRMPLQFRAGPWAAMIGFNLLIGFAGYALRFFAVPKVPTEIFGFLTFAGVLGSFLFGYLFAGERPSWWTLVGAGLIVAAMSHIETLKGVES
jgi:drug/metabolite transporter (DMT)-like permease